MSERFLKTVGGVHSIVTSAFSILSPVRLLCVDCELMLVYSHKAICIHFYDITLDYVVREKIDTDINKY